MRNISGSVPSWIGASWFLLMTLVGCSSRADEPGSLPIAGQGGFTNKPGTGGSTESNAGGAGSGGIASGGTTTIGGASMGGVPTGGVASAGSTAGGKAQGGSSQSGGAAGSAGSGGKSAGFGGVGGVSNSGGNAGSGGRAGSGGNAGSATGGIGAGGIGAGGIGAGGAAGSGGTVANTGGSTSSAGSTGQTRDILIPPSGAWLGMYYGDATLAATQQKLGRSVPLHLVYYAWSDDFTRDATAEDLRAGRVPLINWELFDITLDEILSGSQDTLIQKRAQALKQLAKPLFLDFGAEMNGDWSPWGGAQNGKSADKYIQVYRHVHDIFERVGASNVIWAWCPNVTDVPREPWNEALDYYPGDKYVDWVCVDGYNWGDTNEGVWESFATVFKDIYPKLASKNKPILIGEMASAEIGGNKAAWIDEMIPTLKDRFPAIRALVWFDIKKETDWRIGSSTASLAAFTRLAKDPYFNP
ncbi:MAG TPA: glycosyl hydrolase [Polyangiaceae bacterium]|nr:glycosyl hydrolase [Polyangiaceae bacterium]